MFTKTIMAALASGTILVPVAAVAQTAPAAPAAPEAPQRDDQLSEIIVTAQRRQQTLQDVPVAVAVLGGDQLAAQKISSVETLGTAVPNLVVQRSPFQPFVAIRGLGSGAGGRAFEQSVATYVDGIYAGRANQFLNPFFDVERVEVVRGPQSVLFGVNANAGAINIVNKRPGRDFEGYLTAGYEAAYKGYNFEGGVSVPLGDTFSVRLAGKLNRDGGYVHNTVTGKDDGRADSGLGRVIASWTPNSDLRVDLSYEHGHKRVHGTTFQLDSLGFVAFPPAIEDGVFDFRKSTPDDRAFTRITSDNVALNINYDLGGVTLASSSGYSTFDFSQYVQGANHPAQIGGTFAAEKFKQFYQEVRLVSNGSHFLDYIAGLTYYHQKDTIDQGTDIDFAGFGVPGLTAGARNGLDQTTDGYSAFAQGTLNFTSNFNAVLGGRYSSIRKRGDYVISPTSAGQPLSGYTFDPVSLFVLAGPPFGFFQWFNPANLSTYRPTSISRSRTFKSFNPSASLNYKFSPGLSAYGSYTTGTKAGGFNDQDKSGVVPENGFATDIFEYSAERAYNFEVGLKYSSPTLRLNLAAFRTKYKNLQVSVSLPSGALQTTNAAEATSKGIEGDLTWIVAPGLTFSANAAYLHARYDNYPGACPIGSTFCADPATGNARGGRLDAVPDFSGSAMLAYNVPLSEDWELRFSGRVYHQSSAQYQSAQDPQDRTPGYELFDASVALAQTKGVTLSVSGKNLANKAVRGFSGPSVGEAFYGHYAATLPGRQVFLDLRYDF
jgi:iron complex outermembrane receptor protein